MIVFGLVILLLAFLAAFFSLEFSQTIGELAGVQVNVMGISLQQISQSTNIQAFLGIGIVLLEFGIVLFSMLDRIADTIKEIIKPVARLIPLVAFLAASYQTFAPLVTGLLSPTLISGEGGNSRTCGPIDERSRLNPGHRDYLGHDGPFFTIKSTHAF